MHADQTLNAVSALEVIEHIELVPPKLRLTLLVLALYENSGGRTAEPLALIAEITGKSYRQAARNVAELERLRFLLREDVGPGVVQCYEINFSGIVTETP
jgi:hypothetical protein